MFLVVLIVYFDNVVGGFGFGLCIIVLIEDLVNLGLILEGILFFI